MKTLGRWMEEKGITLEDLTAASGLEMRVVRAIATGNYTPGPDERRRIAAAIDIPIDEVSWSHGVQVQHLRGNGPQTGRAT